MISELQRDTLLDIFENTEVLDKVSISIDETTNTATISYYDMDEEWLNELKVIAKTKMITAKEMDRGRVRVLHDDGDNLNVVYDSEV